MRIRSGRSGSCSSLRRSRECLPIIPGPCVVDGWKRGRPPKCEELKFIARFDNDSARALSKVFDRLTGKPVRAEHLKSYADVLVQYHLSPEHKFANGDYLDRGRTERRHVVATGVAWIGK